MKASIRSEVRFSTNRWRKSKPKEPRHPRRRPCAPPSRPWRGRIRGCGGGPPAGSSAVVARRRWASNYCIFFFLFVLFIVHLQATRTTKPFAAVSSGRASGACFLSCVVCDTRKNTLIVHAWERHTEKWTLPTMRPLPYKTHDKGPASHSVLSHYRRMADLWKPSPRSRPEHGQFQISNFFHLPLVVRSICFFKFQNQKISFQVLKKWFFIFLFHFKLFFVA
jgi:hypothetical protein